MRAKYTAGQFRRGERRIAKHVKVVSDNFGTVYKITASRRILAVFSAMTGEWQAPTSRDGVVRGSMRYVYLVGAIAPAYDFAQVKSDWESVSR